MISILSFFQHQVIESAVVVWRAFGSVCPYDCCMGVQSEESKETFVYIDWLQFKASLDAYVEAEKENSLFLVFPYMFKVRLLVKSFLMLFMCVIWWWWMGGGLSKRVS